MLKEEMCPRLAEILDVIPENYNTSTYRLKLVGPGSLQFKPGQFNMLYVTGLGEVPLSITSDPASVDYVDHTIRFVGSITNVIKGLTIGDKVGLRGPYGSSWPLNESTDMDVMIVAGGIGLAPLRPVIYWISRNRREYGKFFILYGARTNQDLLYRREFEEWRKIDNIEFLVTVDRIDEAWNGKVGVVTTLFEYIKFDPKNTLVMVCGPEIMMVFTIRELLRRGVSAEKIYLSMERNMRCGIGLCGHCQYGPFFICKDGPVFNFSRIQKFFGVKQI